VKAEKTLKNIQSIAIAIALSGTLAACGGGGGGSGGGDGAGTAGQSTSGGTGSEPGGTAGTTTGTGTSTPTPPPAPAALAGSTALTMDCGAAAGTQCSGSEVLRIDNGSGILRSGLQVYGRNSNPSTPAAEAPVSTGLVPATGGVADARLARTPLGVVSDATLILENFGISIDGVSQRPPIIEKFLAATEPRRLTLTGTRAVEITALPAPGDPFFNYTNTVPNPATATLANYLNNLYFPRTFDADPAVPGVQFARRCTLRTSPTVGDPWCANGEREILSFAGTTPVLATGYNGEAGSWRQNNDGGSADRSSAFRWHGDGDVDAGTTLTGPGVPFPGTKGFRNYRSFSFEHANLMSWGALETNNIQNWITVVALNGTEHTVNRRGFSVFGNTTAPATTGLPVAGTTNYPARFQSQVFAWWAPKNPIVQAGTGVPDDVRGFIGNASVTVNWATRLATVTITGTQEPGGPAIPAIAFTTTVALGAGGSNVATYMTGPATATIDGQALAGGLSARFFGPVAPGSAAGGTGPAEIGGTFQLTAPTGDRGTLMGAFIARKQL